MLFEDVHWIDPSSRELLDLVIGARAATCPCCFSSRSAPSSNRRGPGRHTSTMLTSIGSTGVKVQRWRSGSQASKLPSDVVAEIIERTDGVPLFVEELTKAVLEASEAGGGPAVAAVPSPTPMVPATLHGSLMARLDRLGPGLRRSHRSALPSDGSSRTSCWPRSRGSRKLR